MSRDIEISRAVVSAVTTVVRRKLTIDNELAEIARDLVHAQITAMTARNRLLQAVEKRVGWTDK